MAGLWLSLKNNIHTGLSDNVVNGNLGLMRAHGREKFPSEGGGGAQSSLGPIVRHTKTVGLSIPEMTRK